MTSFPVPTIYEVVSEIPEIRSSSSSPGAKKTEIPSSATWENKLDLSELNTSETNVQATVQSEHYSYIDHDNSETECILDEQNLPDQSESSSLLIEGLENKKKRCLTKRQFVILSQITFAFTCQASCYALLVPFFSKEAERKQVTPTQYGFLYGVFFLVIFFLSPVIFKMVPKMSPKFLLNSGVCLGGGATIFLGTLIQSPPGATFLALFFVGRIVQAIGSASLFTLGYAIIADEFTEHRATAMASLDMFYGFGVTVGPAIGGALYEVGGYMLPFFFIGGIMLCLFAIMVYFLPDTKYAVQENKDGLLKIILNPSFIVAMINVLTGFLIVGFNEATLEPHIRQFNLTSSVVGLIFIVSGGIFAVGTLVWGHVYDKNPDSYFPLYISSIVCIASFLFLGPAPFLPLKMTIYLVILAQVLLGIGAGGKVIIGFNHALRITLLRGFPNDVTTISIVSGLVNSAIALGGRTSRTNGFRKWNYGFAGI
ncbi:MFS-type transporter SLC18B1-like isoform X2 [Limulus polyphemus]|uniref:MFS-type transporter SLC18B1-like isoform X2 n=1 Tax=Limulus polyphemus TaxID=6850 RepID=A0ABM1SCY7_LIMPO|nr:MFS-type transporter SLC18B1-like isoform X2 [Limulus polyphemus]